MAKELTFIDASSFPGGLEALAALCESDLPDALQTDLSDSSARDALQTPRPSRNTTRRARCSPC